MRDEADEALVARLSKEDGALVELYRRYAALVFSVAARLVGEATAEEVVQDVFLQVWKKHATFDPERGTFKAWLTQIARRRALNELRSRRGERVQEPEALAQVADEAPALDEARWLAHRQAAVRAAVDSLPEAERRALSLAFFDQLTHAQVARALNAPLGTAKTRIRSGLRRLAPALAAAAAVLLLLLVLRREARETEALRMVTSSDVVPLRLVAASGVPAEAHGNFRARAGATVAVFTASHLPPNPGAAYVLWGRTGEAWHRLGELSVEPDGRSLLITDAMAPDELRVTSEHLSVATPGVPVLTWTR